jgi:hypothetical protein
MHLRPSPHVIASGDHVDPSIQELGRNLRRDVRGSAAFSALAMTKSAWLSLMSLGRHDSSAAVPGRPKTSPTNRMVVSTHLPSRIAKPTAETTLRL